MRNLRKFAVAAGIAAAGLSIASVTACGGSAQANVPATNVNLQNMTSFSPNYVRYFDDAAAGANSSGNAASAADTAPLPILTGNEWLCDHAKPVPFILHAGNAYVVSQPGTPVFTAYHRGAHFNGVYDTVGYQSSLNSGWYCNHRHTYIPPKFGKIGNAIVSAHYVTSSDFRGDTGFDIWMEPNASYNTYAKMTRGGRGTEAMIWTSRPDWRSWAYGRPVLIAGHRWYVVASRVGHNGGWMRVFFVPVSSHNGNISISRMRLDPFFTYLLRHRLVRSYDVLEALDNGAELSAGTMSLAGYSITGLNGA